MEINDLLNIFGIILLIIFTIILLFIFLYLKFEQEKHFSILKILSSILFVSLIGFFIQLFQLKQNEYKNRAELLQVFSSTLLNDDDKKIKKSLMLIKAIDPIFYKKIKNIENMNIDDINNLIKKLADIGAIGVTGSGIGNSLTNSKEFKKALEENIKKSEKGKKMDILNLVAEIASIISLVITILIANEVVKIDQKINVKGENNKTVSQNNKEGNNNVSI